MTTILFLGKRRINILNDNEPYKHNLIGIGPMAFKKCFYQKLKESDFDPGHLSRVDEYLEFYIKNIGPICFKWIHGLYQSNYLDKDFIIRLLKSLSHISGKKITQECITIVEESTQRESIEIIESAVVAFENWEDTPAIPLLEKLYINDDFINVFIKNVIGDLK
jgi:hypothetical protein